MIKNVIIAAMAIALFASTTAAIDLSRKIQIDHVVQTPEGTCVIDVEGNVKLIYFLSRNKKDKAPDTIASLSLGNINDAIELSYDNFYIPNSTEK